MPMVRCCLSRYILERIHPQFPWVSQVVVNIYNIKISVTVTQYWKH